MELDFYRRLQKASNTKMILLVIDGLGGLPVGLGGLTELETANPTNINNLCKDGTCGLHHPIGPGITPGSGPSHLALFGYDPLRYQVGRGVAEAIGIGFDLQEKDVAARGNFCTVGQNGEIKDRRAGRLSTDKVVKLCEILSEIEIPGAELFIEPLKQYRVALILRGDGLSAAVQGTDPGNAGMKPLTPSARKPEADHTISLLQKFLSKSDNILADHYPANKLILRGFGRLPDWPGMNDLFRIKAAAVADTPVHKGIAQLAGMEALDASESLEEKIETVRNRWDDFDFFFLHVKSRDSAGEDGDFDRKVALIREVDEQIPCIMKLGPDVVVVTGDHSTPASLKSHSWHPVPFLLWSKCCRPDRVDIFHESSCINGGFGPNMPATGILPLMLANAQRLGKFEP